MNETIKRRAFRMYWHGDLSPQQMQTLFGDEWTKETRLDLFLELVSEGFDED